MGSLSSVAWWPRNRQLPNVDKIHLYLRIVPRNVFVTLSPGHRELPLLVVPMYYIKEAKHFLEWERGVIFHLPHVYNETPIPLPKSNLVNKLLNLLNKELRILHRYSMPYM